MSTTVKLKANCDDPQGEDRERKVYLQLIPVVVQQKSIQHCKAIILQFKINLKKIKTKVRIKKGKTASLSTLPGTESKVGDDLYKG